MATADNPNQPDYMIFDEVGMDAAGFNNGRVRTLFIGFTTLPNPPITINSLPIDPSTGEFEVDPVTGHQGRIMASVAGCEIVGGIGTCSNQGIGLTAGGIFKIRHDVDFLFPNTKPRLSPCAHLRAAGFPSCPQGGTLEEEFGVLQPLSRDIIGYTNHPLDPGIVTVDINGQVTQNGAYLNPNGIGHPEFVEIDLNAIATPLIFTATPWSFDRRVGPGGFDTPGAALAPLTPFPYSELDPRHIPGIPLPSGTYNDPTYNNPLFPLSFAYDRILSHYPFEGDTTVY